MNFSLIKVKRVPNENIYGIFITLVMVFSILTIIYALTPNNHCNAYFK